MNTLLIANRGEIALRIASSARALGLRTVAVYSDADRNAPHVRGCDMAIRIGGPPARDSYLNISALIAAAEASGADAVHPGYGFLAENADFARACVEAGLVFVGPPAAAIAAIGNKAVARQRMLAAGIACIPGFDEDTDDVAILSAEAERIGFPLMIKAAAGGGGRGMRLVQVADQLGFALASARSEALNAFGDGRLILERALLQPRHVEVQVFADRYGNIVHLGERECSIQRRHQKIIEEAPSPAVDTALRERMGAAAVAVARDIAYVGAGTVEFLLDQDGAFYFMEMNTRLQVEHPVTEAVTGLDLVAMQLRVAAGEALTAMLPRLQDDVRFSGHAIEARLCAEDPARDFLPATGVLAFWQPPAGLRTDHGLASGQEISPWYDSMLAKVIAHAPTRALAAEQLADGLDRCVALGLTTNRRFLARVLRHPAFLSGDFSTAFIAQHFPDNAARSEPVTEQEWALAALIAARAPRRCLPIPAELAGWNSAGLTQRRVRLACGDETRVLDVRIDRDGNARINSTQAPDIALRCVDPWAQLQIMRVAVDQVMRRLLYVLDGDRILLQVQGREAIFADQSLHAAARAEDANAAIHLLAPINGRVVQVNKQVGAAVARGDVLMVLEAMKMEHPVLARGPGQIAELLASVNDQVQPGQLLVRLQSASAIAEKEGS